MDARAKADDETVLVYATFPSVEAAEDVGRAVVEGGFAACVNMIPGMVSIYAWKGAVERASETVLIAKTRRSLADALTREILRRHSYENPAVVVLPIQGGSPDYLAWIRESANAPPA